MVFGLGPWSKRVGISGLEWHYLKKHYSLIPVMVTAVVGNLFYCAYLGRMLMTHPEMTFRRKTNPEPWNAYYNKQVKFWDAGRDYTVPSPAPKYR